MTLPTNWLVGYEAEAALSDRFSRENRRSSLLAAGLLGEVGSLAAEYKKSVREGAAYPAYRRRIVEELGDCLWYLVRVAEAHSSELLADLRLTATQGSALQNRP